MADEDARIQGFLAAGHVCTIMALAEYYPIVEKYKVPIVVTGFEPADLLQGILMTVRQLEQGKYFLDNQYTRVVQTQGNPEAPKVIKQVFEVADREWRGVGMIPLGGYEFRTEFENYDANKKFAVNIEKAAENSECIAGLVLKGIKKPHECSQFGKKCTPQTPLGAPMVSSEGACAAYYHFAQAMDKIEAV